MNSTRSTDFMTPKSAVSRLFRESVLDLVEHVPFARALVNSGATVCPCGLRWFSPEFRGRERPALADPAGRARGRCSDRPGLDDRGVDRTFSTPDIQLRCAGIESKAGSKVQRDRSRNYATRLRARYGTRREICRGCGLGRLSVPSRSACRRALDRSLVGRDHRRTGEGSLWKMVRKSPRRSSTVGK